MRVDCVITDEAFDKIQTSWFKNPQQRLKGLVLLFFYIGLPVLLLAALGLWVSALIGLSLCLSYMFKRKNDQLRNRKPIHLDVTIEITSDYIALIRSNGMSSKWHWSLIKTVEDNTGGVLMSIREDNSMLFVPAAAFESPMVQTEFFNTAKDYHQQANTSGAKAVHAADAGWFDKTSSSIAGRTLQELSWPSDLKNQQLGRSTIICSLVAGTLVFAAWYLQGFFGGVVGLLAYLMLAGTVGMVVRWLKAMLLSKSSGYAPESLLQLRESGYRWTNGLASQETPWSAIHGMAQWGDGYAFVASNEESLLYIPESAFDSEEAPRELAEMVDQLVETNQAEGTSTNESEAQLEQESFPAEEQPRPGRNRWVTMFLLSLPILGLILGIYGNWPWIKLEHQRQEWWKPLPLWGSEFIAIFWYLRYMLSVLTQGSSVRHKSHAFLVWATFLAGFGADLAISLNEIQVESTAWNRAVDARSADAVSGKHEGFGDGKGAYRIHCEFVAQDGGRHRCDFATQNTDFPNPLRWQIEAGEYPFPVAVKYDPKFPQRSWLADTPSPHYNRIYYLSLTTLLFSTLFGLLFMLLHRDNPDRNILPIEAAPFLAVSLTLFFPGIMMLIFGQI